MRNGSSLLLLIAAALAGALPDRDAIDAIIAAPRRHS